MITSNSQYIVVPAEQKRSLRAEGEAISQHIKNCRDCRPAVAGLLAMTDIYPSTCITGLL